MNEETDAPSPDGSAERLFKLYTLYATSAETVSERRADANKWMLTVNGSIVGLYGYLAAGKASIPGEDHFVWLLAIPCAGAIICLAWAALLASYSKLNEAKFKVIHELEANLPAAPYLREQEIYRALGRRSLSKVEKAVPFVLIVLYAAFAIIRLAAL